MGWRESLGVLCRSWVLGGHHELPALRRRGPGLPGMGGRPVGASRGLSHRRPRTATGSLCPPKPQSGEGGTKASAAETVFAGSSFGVSFSLPITLPGKLGASAARHWSTPGTSLGATAPPLAPSLRTRGLLLNSRGIKCIHIFISRKHILKYKGNWAVGHLMILLRVQLPVQRRQRSRAPAQVSLRLCPALSSSRFICPGVGSCGAGALGWIQGIPVGGTQTSSFYQT